MQNILLKSEKLYNLSVISKKVELFKCIIVFAVIFPWCGSIINGGINKEELERIILKVIKKDCNILAISEYIPNWDFQFEGATMIISLIKLFLLRK